jgi:Na+-transporting NADH:ubiquinone oxidoreductase subunit B
MTSRWVEPMWGGLGGLGIWSPLADAVTQATPMVALRSGSSIPLEQLFFGYTSGCLGETSDLLILLAGVYLLYTKAASYRLAFSCLLGGSVFSAILYGLDVPSVPSPLLNLLSGSFLFGTVFVVTEPVSGAKTGIGQWIYGFMIGSLTVVLRGFSNFSEGIMFSVLIMNAFVPILDKAIQQIQAPKAVTS